MVTGTEEIIVPIGGRFEKIYDFLDSTGNAEDFSGRTGTLIIKNIAEAFEDEASFTCTNAVEVEPLDTESNIIKGRIVLSIAPEDTAKLKIPEDENDPYMESGRYAIATVKFDNNEIPLNLIIRPIKIAE